MWASGEELKADARNAEQGVTKAISRLAIKKREERRAREAKQRKGK